MFSPGSDVKYSDLGIIILTDIVSIITRRELDDIAMSWIYKPLGMESTLYNPGEELLSRVVPTENDDYFRKQLLVGLVHDENAFLFSKILSSSIWPPQLCIAVLKTLSDLSFQ